MVRGSPLETERYIQSIPMIVVIKAKYTLRVDFKWYSARLKLEEEVQREKLSGNKAWE